MGTVLETIEKEGALQARAHSRTLPPPKSISVIAAALLITPFLVVQALFVPLLGLALVFLSLALSIYYLWCVGSLKVTAMAAVGVTVSALLLVLVPVIGKGYLTSVGYMLLGVSTFISLVYIVGIGILIFSRLNSES